MIVWGCGSRERARVDSLIEQARALVAEVRPLAVLTGGQTGGDALWEQAAARAGIQVVSCPISRAQWGRLGPRAGAMRNRLVADLAAFLGNHWRGEVECWALPGDAGTAMAKRIARQRGWLVLEVKPQRELSFFEARA